MPEKFKTELVLFDVAGTLLEVRGSVGEIYARFARNYGIEIEPEIVQSGFLRSFGSQPPMAFPPGIDEDRLQQSEYGWWRKMVRDVFVGVDFPRFEEFFAGVFEFFRTRQAWLVFDDVLPTLEHLKERGIRTAVVSNFDSRLFDLLKAFNLDRFFDSYHLSTRTGAAKPHPAIFHAAIDRHRIDPRSALHVGDGLREDFEGAQAAGIRAVLLDRGNRYAENPRLVRITSLEQLPELLE